MLTYLYVALGGAIGSVARFGIASAIDRAVGDPFPIGTVLVNITGCFIIGLLTMVTLPAGRMPVAPELRAFLMVGLCGGYTTFSSFSLQTLVLARDGDMMRAGLNVVVSVACCLVGVWLGLKAGAAIGAEA
jgi:CrcB protein